MSIIELSEDENDGSAIELANIRVSNEKLLGRLVSMLFLLIGGHIYYRDNIIKIRYDILREAQQMKDFTEEEIFDYFPHCIPLGTNTVVQSKFPLAEFDAHRLVFMTRSIDHTEAPRIAVLPYLHERQILLRKLNPLKKYFSTILQRANEEKDMLVTLDLTAYRAQFFSTSGIYRKTLLFDKQVKQLGTPRAVSSNGLVYLFVDRMNYVINVMVLSDHGF